MFTRNYDAFNAIINCCSGSATYPMASNLKYDGSEESVTLKDAVGNIKPLTSISDIFEYYKIFGQFYATLVNSTMNGNISNKIRFFSIGSGTTPPKYDDVKLENEIDPSKVSSVSNETISPIYDNGYLKSGFIARYTANEDITISEIGIYLGYDKKMYLLSREVLDTPIEVKAGNEFKLSFIRKYPLYASKPEDFEFTVVTE